MKIVGIAGLPRSGKDTLAQLYMDKGYFGVSLGDIVRDEARRRHANDENPISVANMTETSNWLRSQKGPDFALKEAIVRYEIASKDKDYKGLVVFSVRAPVEADFILQNNGQLIWVETSDEIRVARNNSFLREGEKPVSLEDFKRQEALQWQPQPDLPAAIQMNVAYVKSKATTVLENNGNDIESFLAAAAKTLGL